MSLGYIYNRNHGKMLPNYHCLCMSLKGYNSNHGNICLISMFLCDSRGVCTQAPCYCIVMEYCPYGQLYEVLRDGRELPPYLLLDWGKQIASGMNYLNAHKIIHRDLKSPK